MSFFAGAGAVSECNEPVMAECVFIKPDAAYSWLDLRDSEAMAGMERWIRDNDAAAVAPLSHAKRQRSSILGRALLRYLAGRLLPGIACFIAKTDAGRPYLRDESGEPVAFASISHSRDIVAVAVDCHRPIGIDVEYCRADRDYSRIADKIFPPEIAERISSAAIFYQAWCLYEAWGKAHELNHVHPGRNGGLMRLLESRLVKNIKAGAKTGGVVSFVPAGGYAGCVVGSFCRSGK